ncbi:MAG: DUF5067 domain-containing protein, partial [Lachnospiraceae bacterium]|nr:DUF5067 domain-containing protein [Lachnospiraceae bacterium]
IFVLLDTEISNDSSKELNVSSILSFEVYCDGYKQEYSFNAVLNADGQMDGSVEVGKKLKGQQAYEVPKDWKELEIHFKPVLPAVCSTVHVNPC